MKEEMKTTQSEIKENIQGTNSEGKETGTENQRFGTKARNKHPTGIEWRNKNSKNKERLINLWDNFKHSNILIIGVPEEEEKQEIENLFEQIMKENFPSLEKEIDMQIQEAQRVPKKLDPRRSTPRHIIIKLPKIKDKERILKAEREKETVTYKGVPIRQTISWFLKRNLTGKKELEKKIFEVMKGKDLHPRLLYPAVLSFRMEG